MWLREATLRVFHRRVVPDRPFAVAEFGFRNQLLSLNISLVQPCSNSKTFEDLFVYNYLILFIFSDAKMINNLFSKLVINFVAVLFPIL